MSKKRANKSKRRRESQQPPSGGAEPRLKLVSGMAGPAANAEPVPTPRTSDFELASDETRLSDPPSSSDVADDDVHEHEHEGRFFDDGHKIQTPHAFSVEELDLEVEPPKPSPKMSPLARARRAHFSKYVKGAMVAATAILALAGIRAVIGHADRDPQSYAAQNLAAPGIVEVRHGSTAAAAATVGTTGANVAHAPEPARDIPPPPEPVKAEPEKPVEAKAPSELVKAEPVAAPPAPVEPEKAEPVAAPTPAKVEPAKTEPVAAAPAPAKADDVPGALTAAQEKVESRKALERGKAGLAIEAGERSVALDPTDGEAWLILGAAYQEKGNVKDARRAFQSCTKEGKRGPISECRAMLQ